MQKNPIQLDKILLDIAKEKALHPFNTEAVKKDVDDAWARVGKNNNLSVHESRSIFKVLQKKYDQEKLKSNTSWKLFAIMDQIHKREEPKYESSEEQNGNSMEEEEEEYEMLDVQEEDKGDQGNFGSEDESSNKSTVSNGCPKSDKIVVQQKQNLQKTPSQQQQQTSNNSSNEDKKVLNSLVGTQKVSNLSISINQTTAAALQKKGITMKKASNLSGSPSTPLPTNQRNANSLKSSTIGRNTTMTIVENPKAIQLNDSLKRKLNDELQTPVSSTSAQQFKKIHLGHKSTISNQQNSSSLLQPKKEIDDNDEKKLERSSSTHGINIITIPANPHIELTNGSGEASSSMTNSSTINSNTQNGFSSNLADLNIKSEIIFDENQTNDLNNSNADNIVNEMTKISSKPGDIINFGNFDNTLPPTFFKNLCNSSRHEALGLYVANVMNRLSGKSASKLELKILKALVDIQTEEAEQ